MITLPEYRVMGEDGQDYGPVDAKQIRIWVAEQRLERKTPIKSGDMKDWDFLGSLPEFADLFAPPAPPKPKRRLPKLPLAMAAALVAGLVWLALKKFNQH